MLSEDPKLRFLGMAWSSSEMAEFFNRHVLPTVWPGQEVGGVSIEDMTYLAGTQCDILYSLQFRDRLRAQPGWAVATFRRGKRLQKIFASHYGVDRDASATPASCPAISLPEYQCLVELFPSDWELPSLSRAMQPAAIVSLHSEVGCHTLTRSSSRTEVKVLRYRPHLRCVICYVRESPQGKSPISVIGKVYPPGPKAAQAWHALKTLDAHTIPGIIVPRPLGLAAGLNLVLMEYVPGRSMNQVLEEGTAPGQAQEATRLVAKALATLHRLKIENGELRSVESQLKQTRKTNARLYLVAPDLARQVDAILDEIAPLASRFSFETPSWVHGDCQPSQFLINERQVAIVDFDWAGRGDAALDVGNFAAALHKRALQGQAHLRELASYFLAEYRARVPDNGVVARARVAHVAALARMAVHSFRRSPHAYHDAGAQSLPALLLEEATTCLASL